MAETPFIVSGGANPLQGKAALVTGAAKRIGRTIALELARAGADIGITYLNSEREAQDTLTAIRDLGRRAFAAKADLTRADEIQAAVGCLIGQLGSLDMLVNNAGFFESAVMEEITVEQWDHMFATNTRAPFLVAQAAHEALKKAKGRIVNVGSLGGIHPWSTHAHYCTSKAALHMLSQTMAKAWAPEISVNCVAPGMIVQGEVGEAYQYFADKTPMRRNGTAEDVAAAVLFFAAAPHFITGQLVAVDGGLGL